MKLLKHLSLSILFLSTLGCQPVSAERLDDSSKISKNAKSFVQIFHTTKIISCRDKKDKQCPIGEFTQTGSGIKIDLIPGENVVLTAGHVCDTQPTKKVSKFTQTTAVRDTKNEIHQAWPINITFHDTTKGSGDLCLLWVPSLEGPGVKISSFAPKVGSEIYYLGAPMGIFHPPTVPIFKGIFSGKIDNTSSIITAPGIGGVSGGPVFDQTHEVVGVIFAVNARFHHVSLIVNYDLLKTFLKESTKKFKSSVKK